MTYHHADVLFASKSLVDIVGKALSGHTHDILVHAVRARTHDTAETAGTKLQILIKCIDEGCLVLIL